MGVGIYFALAASILIASVLTACGAEPPDPTGTPEQETVASWYGTMSDHELAAVACGHIGRAFGSYTTGNTDDERAHAIVVKRIDSELNIGLFGDVTYGDALQICAERYGVNVAVNGISPSGATPEPTDTPTVKPSPTTTHPQRSRPQSCMELVLEANDKILEATQAGFDSPRAASLTREANALLLRAERGQCK